MNTKRKKSRKKKKGTNNRLYYRILISIGILFVLSGLYYIITSNEELLYKWVLNFGNSIQPATGVEFQQDWKGLPVYCLYYFPAIIGILVGVFFHERFKVISGAITILSTVYLISFHLVTNTPFFGIVDPACYLPNVYVALFFLFLPIAGYSLIIYSDKNPLYVILSCLYFYVSVHAYLYSFSDFHYGLILSTIPIFNVILLWLGIKTKRTGIHVTSFIFGLLYSVLLLIRRFALNSTPDYVTDFLIYAFAFYLIHSAGVLFIQQDENKPGAKTLRIHWFMSVTNVLFFVSAVAYIVLKYYSFNYLWVCMLGLLLINTGGVYLIRKYVPGAVTAAFDYMLPVLAALVLPLLIHFHGLFLFFVVLAGLFMLTAARLQKRLFIRLSLLALIPGITLYVAGWVLDLIPVLFESSINASLLWGGITDNAVFLISLVIIRKIIHNKEAFELPAKSTLIRNYRLFTDSVFFTVSYVSVCWTFFSMLCALTGSTLYAPAGWFIAGSGYFICMIRYYSGKNSQYKKIILYAAYISSLSYPVLSGWNVDTENLILEGKLNFTALTIHYLALGLFVALQYMTIKRIYLRNIKKYTMVRQLVKLLTVLLLVFSVCIEYDNITLILQSFSSSDTNLLSVVRLDKNQYLPYTVVLWILSVCLFIYGVIRNYKIFKSSALVLFSGVVLKFFTYDFQLIETEKSSLILILLGLFLIVAALIYPRIKSSKQL